MLELSNLNPEDYEETVLRDVHSAAEYEFYKRIIPDAHWECKTFSDQILKNFLSYLDYDVYPGSTPTLKAASVAKVYRDLLRKKAGTQQSKSSQDSQDSQDTKDSQDSKDSKEPKQSGQAKKKQKQNQQEKKGKPEDSQDSKKSQPQDSKSEAPDESEDSAESDNSKESQKDPQNQEGKKGSQPSSELPNVAINRNDDQHNLSMQTIKDIVKKREDLLRLLQRRTEELKLMNGTLPHLGDLVHEITKDDLTVLNNLSIVEKIGKIRTKRRLISSLEDNMQSYSQVSRLRSPKDFLHPLFNYRFAKKQLRVRESEKHGKQALCLMIDDSGSMSEQKKVLWVKTLLLNRMMEVKKGQAVLYVFTFEQDIIGGLEIKKSSHETFLQAWKMFSFNLGCTEIDKVIHQFEQGMRAKSLKGIKITGEKPQLVIVHDGNDQVKFMTPENPTHAFLLGQDNPDLKKVIEKSEGVYLRLM